MDKQQMTEPFEWKGVWWLPEVPDKRINGNLKYHPTESATLDLFGSLRGVGVSFPLEADIVLGELPNGKPVTLFSCCESGANTSIYTLSSSDGFSVTKLKASYVFEGEHFLTKEDIKFKTIYLGLSHLRNWAVAVPVEPSGDEDKVIITYEPPDDIEVTLPNIGNLTLYHTTSISNSFKGAILAKEVGIKIEAEKPTSFLFWVDTPQLAAYRGTRSVPGAKRNSRGQDVCS